MNPPSSQSNSAVPHASRVRWRFLDWAWFIGKNILGWILILSSGPVGMAVPGPGGIPMFLIGFALITFPGKRNVTARVLRGSPVSPRSTGYQIFVGAFALLVPAGGLSYLAYLAYHDDRWMPFLDRGADPNTWIYDRAVATWTLAYFALVTLLWIFGIRGVRLINLGLKAMARGRRRVRPWLRGKGMDLLPPRRRMRLRRRYNPQDQEPDDGILEIHQRHQTRLRNLWRLLRPWLIRLVRVLVIGGVFLWMLKPIIKRWHDPVVRQSILSTSIWEFAGAAFMFAFFLFAFRSMVWRRIISKFGHPLPIAPAMRIWSLSELARYLPGAIWQVVGRVYLAKPYGIRGSVCSASQLLELCIFMLSNVIVAVACITAAGLRLIPPGQRHWLYLSMGFVPLLMTLLHPRVFYGLLNIVMRKLKKEPIQQALRKRSLTWLTLWTIGGLLWQSLALWVLTHSVLGLPLEKWYVVAGAYCLAWTIGFSVGFLAPGGIGIREAVFITTLKFLLPPSWRAAHPQFDDPTLLAAFLGFLGILLRLWAIAGELTMASIATLADLRGALGRSDAPGRATATAS